MVAKMWGLKTEASLRALTDAFPSARVTFRAAVTSD